MRRSVQRQNRKKLNQRRSVRALNLFGGRPPKAASAAPADAYDEVEVYVNGKIALLRVPKINNSIIINDSIISAYNLHPRGGEAWFEDDKTSMISAIPSLSGYTFTIYHETPHFGKSGHYVLTRRS